MEILIKNKFKKQCNMKIKTWTQRINPQEKTRIVEWNTQ